MASIDSVLNAYLLEEGFSWSPVLRLAETPVDAGGLGVQRRKWQAPRYEGRLVALFPTQALYETFRTFWAANIGAVWTWTNPDDAVAYNCRFVGDRLGYERVGADGWEVEFEARGVPA